MARIWRKVGSPALLQVTSPICARLKPAVFSSAIVLSLIRSSGPYWRLLRRRGPHGQVAKWGVASPKKGVVYSSCRDALLGPVDARPRSHSRSTGAVSGVWSAIHQVVAGFGWHFGLNEHYRGGIP